MGIPLCKNSAAPFDIGGRAWWQLTMQEVGERAASLGWVDDAKHRRPTNLNWDDNGMLQFAGQKIPRKWVEDLLLELGKQITAKGIGVRRLPNLLCVRLGTARDEFCSRLFIVDVDLGAFILPVAADEETIRNRPDVATLAAEMVGVIEWVDGERSEILERELKFRSLVEDAASNGGAGMVPLWLRMLPWDPNVIPLGDPEYSLITLQLDEDLIWSFDERSIGDEKRLLKAVEHTPTLRRRASAKDAIERTGYGLVCDVALALMNQHGLDPMRIFELLQGSRLAERHRRLDASPGHMDLLEMYHADRPATRQDERPGSLEITTGNTRETLALRDGVVELEIEFDGGSYRSGSLRLFGDYPLSVAIAAKGMRLDAVVEHPAFTRAGVIINDTRLDREGLHLLHDATIAFISNAATPECKQSSSG